MREPDVIVIGGGPAGVAGAIEVAAAGHSVMLCEQRNMLGGAIYRQPASGANPVPPLPSLAGRWPALLEGLSGSNVEVLLRRSFFGVDSTGAVLIENRETGRVEMRRPRALILACGAIERVRPRPGWQLEGVVAAGGLQVMLKEGRVPAGRILLAGSGPLLLALAAQMTAAGNAPVAVVEAGDPLRKLTAGFGLLMHPLMFADAARLLAPVLGGRFPWRRSTTVSAIARSDGRLTALLRDAAGREERLEVDRIALHDGLRPNDFGLPNDGIVHGLLILRAGDVREVLGASAAEIDGRRAAREALARLMETKTAADARGLTRERRLQASLARLFEEAEGLPSLMDCRDDTVICRCENRTLGDFKAQMQGPDALSPRELRLNGRFGMGACQGRFCADWTLSLMASLRPEAADAKVADMLGHRWPLRPVQLSALANADLCLDTDQASRQREEARA